MKGSWAALLLLGCHPASERGEALFTGRAPLTGHIVGHDTALPPEASRCVNCHAAGTAIPLTGVDAGGSFGPALTGALLLDERPRRGGPKSRYDEARFCKLLSEGIDPADIIIERAMPRYALSRDDCAALWSYLRRL